MRQIFNGALNTFKRYILSGEISLEGRTFNICMSLAFLGSVAGSVATLLQASSLISIISIFLLPIAIALILGWVNSTKRYRLGSILACVFICDLGFPFVFFSGGGLYSGMHAYLILGTVIISFLLKGKDFAVMLIGFFLITLGCFSVSYYKPELVTPIATRFLMFIDFSTAFILTSTLVGFIIKYQIREYVKAHKQMEAERSRAEAASKAKSDFLSNMSHEMRTPMNAIIGMTTIAKGSTEIEKKNYCLEKIEAASNHLLGVINDILDMSKIEANKFELSPSECSIEKIIQKAVMVNNFRVAEKQQLFTLDIDRAIPEILICDDQRLTQVITNLLSNAVKFTHEQGSINLRAKFIKKEDEYCTIQIEVSDSGIGISKEQQARLFSSFAQADSGISRKFGGTGLGLAISKRIVEMMGGVIWVESEPGKGSTFAFTIKVKRGNNLASNAASEPEPAGISDADRFEGCRILLAEDVEINREIVMVLLEPTGIEIDCAENGVEAVKKFSANPAQYNMIFMDVQMPEMSGYEATQKIRALENAREGHIVHIPIVAMTANVFREDIERCLASGMNDHIGKPLNLNDMLEKIRRYV